MVVSATVTQGNSSSVLDLGAWCLGAPGVGAQGVGAEGIKSLILREKGGYR